ncbi:SDR family oxidoreductase [Amycolatopsis sp. PS_44_ISF1]|uniref:SDR family oxidoreductase n=1 Tax=Amycolatopsis sp. PS_44_ISF1 TaxID=2974917 RepID=UPI0028DEB097|nr:SDR family oxidoreductase [Amycolatopsis sp. PS_44_ISF1]MDT8914987.1 SDR family oxidoreductase [Amycolatopsis sp. PS_44_ISF1]
MDLELRDKVAIVGGGSDGLGFAIADRLLAEGAFVTIFARRAEKVADAAARLSRQHGAHRILGLAADCSVDDDLQRVTAQTLDRFGPAVHVLVTNDGGPPIRPISELDDRTWLTAFERHFFFVVRSVRATLPHMKADGGSILNVVSAVTRRPAAGMAAPVAVWSAVIGYARTLALEVGEHDINVNTLLTGYFDTPLLDQLGARQPELSGERLARTLPLGRIGQPREFAGTVAALVSPLLRYVTGTVVPVDGGAGVGLGPAFGSAAPATPAAPTGSEARS